MREIVLRLGELRFMRMLAGLGVAVVLVAVGYLDRTRNAGLGDVAHCLSGTGASVERSPAPPGTTPWNKLLGRGESDVYEVDFDGDRGTLLRTGRGVGPEQLQGALDAEGTRVTAQLSGRTLVLWHGRPAARSAAVLNRCLHS